MPIPAGGFPRAAAVSPRVEAVETTDSTNADVIAGYIAHPDAWPHLALRLTTDQRAGRGRLNRSWTAPPGTALAVSVVLRVSELPLAKRGWIPLIAGAAMTRAVAGQMRSTDHSVTMKWPNDVLVDGGKICGILAEAVSGHPDAVVVGCGINTRMTDADLPVSNATSFQQIGVDVDDDLLLAEYLGALDEQLSALVAAGGDAAAAGVLGEIEALCATVGSVVRVTLPDGTLLEGRVPRIDADGRLIVTAGGFDTAVSAGDVIHVR